MPEPARASRLMPLPSPRPLAPTARVPDKPCTVVLWDNDTFVHIGTGPRPGRPGRPVIDADGVVYASVAAAARHLGKDTSTLHKRLQQGRNLWPVDAATARAVFEVPTFPATAPTPAPPAPTPAPMPSTCSHVWQAGSARCIACDTPLDDTDVRKAIKDLLDDFDVPANPDLTARLRVALLEMEAARDLLRKTRALFNPEK